MEVIIKHTIGSKTYSKTVERIVKYACSVSYYYKKGMVHNSDLYAKSLDELQEKKDEALAKAKEDNEYEVVTFGNTIMTTTDVVKETNEVHYFVDKTTNTYLMTLARPPRNYGSVDYVVCRDKYYNEVLNGDRVDVQKAGIFKVYAKNGQLYFKPYGEEERVSGYFSNDMVRVDENNDWICKDI